MNALTPLTEAKAAMEPLRRMPRGLGARIRFVLTDVDDTLTRDGRLDARTYAALDRLQRAGIRVVPVTAAPAGWCDAMARMWPVDAVIGENGGLHFVRDPESGTVRRFFRLGERARRAAMVRLAALGRRIVAQVPGAALAPDQAYRETTLALNFPGGDPRGEGAARAQLILRRAGARTTVNSLWVLGWFGKFDKLEAAGRLLPQAFGVALEAARDRVFYVGDSINDEPMFDFFPHAAGVSTLRAFAPRMAALPPWIAARPGGAGFVEVANALLRARKARSRRPATA